MSNDNTPQNPVAPVTVVKGNPQDEEIAALVASLVAAAQMEDSTEPDAHAKRAQKARLRWRDSMRQDYSRARSVGWSATSGL